MANTLVQLWKENPSLLQGKLFRQIIQLAGDGRLRDGSQTSTELREWLRVVDLEWARRCAEECLAGGFEDSGFALQDVVNEIGFRLGFEVTPGRYRGVKNEIGNDGLWRGDDGFTFLVEVKTTDAYRINLDTISAYREDLIAKGSLKERTSAILIAVGRQDTGDLEAQIRGSSHAWDIRLISIDALLRLADVKWQLDDGVTSKKINQLLRPVEYTRLDGIVELLFAAKQDLEALESAPPGLPVKEPLIGDRLTPAELETARETGVQKVESKFRVKFARRGKARRSTSDGMSRLVCLVSQRYKGSPTSYYWYGFTPPQKEFIEGAGESYLALVCADSTRTYLIPRAEILAWLPDLWTTPPGGPPIEDLRHWHLYLADQGGQLILSRSEGRSPIDLTRFLVS